MRKAFWDDPYQTELSTKVARVDGDQVLLDDTIIFSFCGGQESDRGQINGYEVIDSKIVGKDIFYTLSNDHNLRPGDHVDVTIDWSRRHRLMRLHFAAELVLEIVTKKYGFEKIGAHISEAKARIDFICGTNISHVFETVLADYNEIIQQDRPIKTGYIDVENQRRYWEIDGFSKVPCGGTHVKSTAEVGYIKLKRVNPGGSKERIEIKLVNA